MASIPADPEGGRGSRCGAPGSTSQGRLLLPPEAATPSQVVPSRALPPSQVSASSHADVSRVPPWQNLPCHTTTPPPPPSSSSLAAGGPRTSPPRKRQRLVHLSTEEKVSRRYGEWGVPWHLFHGGESVEKVWREGGPLAPFCGEKVSRRKLKNRVAAQSARDRKMALMCDLEKKAEELRAKNRLLVEKNRALKAQSLNLAHQNLELRRRLSKDVFQEQEAAQDKCLDDHSVVAGSSESAVLRGAVPQQWVLTRPPSQLVVLTFAVLSTALRTPSAVICLVSWMSWIWICLEMLIRLWAKTLKITQEVHLVKQKKKIPYRPPHLQIWGAHQLSWTPIMI
ncbi:X-box-binding protein 1 isoform X1 [Lethenteron reissneri]|uniref:X-box-binding protein 1 isoform X1 n=1 Tax=Lethenteron reissneri TaxID=7753 RepID=UPI002AB6C8E9|nr:X-box-binding protein 1 isoform X1 [Lethenteron reissneri]